MRGYKLPHEELGRRTESRWTSVSHQFITGHCVLMDGRQFVLALFVCYRHVSRSVLFYTLHTLSVLCPVVFGHFCTIVHCNILFLENNNNYWKEIHKHKYQTYKHIYCIYAIKVFKCRVTC